ncbi:MULTISPECIES: tRNA lysidine(34) synthetase TilS [unclassified Mesorhizobium]|uniref:tRNA lysidine(34) synthetase TilS n=1 Tax=unclassified Mesorhizobium TaxID=325217 RepID=UPI000FD8C642|nr:MULTISPECIES: tRNA lysidine(34) synthetase TilS [unclassified Mesorhizobium]TGQ44041.1 tRNA lysidine(34) synthetase TilS [Mesorhizobium sp. M00.F.Ca.ET.216.01.1.1]TIS59186.1 MAG: tRNA lysidine(34) synthetase TilS [Mesorhizobium sp.]TIS90875.1 MAG: tRNA lysidine(34) synthetase TilS [Mesorhizobium sp.]TJW16071.1 MAG: tRNA lysidine(34) synthetase TilS [Mesorhizobium sp.]
MLTLDTKPDLPERLFSQIDFTNGAVAAVSGGSDSTALLLLLKDHLDRTAPAAKLLAVTVDHGLRPSSAAEARAVAGLCAGRGITHRILAWSGPKPSTGLPAAAREARYGLLAKAARAEGIGLILTGHTADDQAETVLMRQARDEGRGLAGMALATLYEWRTWIVRPLLGMRRAALRNFLQRENVGWAEDPTNVDEHFERPRIRAMLAGEGGVPRFAEAITLAGRAAKERELLGHRAAALVRSFASRPATGLVRLDREFATSGDDRAAVYALRILLAATGGISFLPDEACSEALFVRLKGGPLCATLSRTVIDARRAGIFLRREFRNLPPAQPAAGTALWDGRRRITLGDKSRALLIAPLGSAAAAKRAIAEDGTPPSLVRAALAAEPALWRGDECLGLPQETQASAALAACPVVAPFARFLPSFDLAPADAVARLVGALPAPALPFGGHSAG